MPTYDYVCSTCGHRFEVIHGVNGPAPERCPRCGARTLRKAFSPPTFHFKGSGWAKKERNSAANRKAAVKSGDVAPSTTDAKASTDKPAADKSGSDKSGSDKSGGDKSATTKPTGKPGGSDGGTSAAASAGSGGTD